METQGLYELIVSLVLAAFVYYAGSLFPNDLVKKLAMLVAAVIAVLALLAFLKQYLGA
jgi:hypothetical protein